MPFNSMLHYILRRESGPVTALSFIILIYIRYFLASSYCNYQ